MAAVCTNDSIFLGHTCTSSPMVTLDNVTDRINLTSSSSSILEAIKQSVTSSTSDNNLFISSKSSSWDYVPDDFDGMYYVNMLRNNMRIVETIALCYVMTVFGLQSFMKGKSGLQIKRLTIGWNLFLALFSWICFFTFTPESISVYQNLGHDGIICKTPSANGSLAFWYLLFIASKIWEFGDTILLIVRKKPVIFLHWYHHTTVLMLSCFIGGRNSPLRRVFANVNSGIHGVMYSYYALAAIGYRPPKYISMAITSTQLIQMIAGVYVCVQSYFICPGYSNSTYDTSSATFSLVIYFSYLLLFAHFFYTSYFSPDSQKRRRDARMKVEEKKEEEKKQEEKKQEEKKQEEKKDDGDKEIEEEKSSLILNNNEQRRKERIN